MRPSVGEGALDGIRLGVPAERSQRALPVREGIRKLAGFELSVAARPVGGSAMSHRVLMHPSCPFRRGSQRRGAEVVVLRIKGLRLAVFLHSGLKTSDVVKVYRIVFVCFRRIRSKLDGAPVGRARF